jgi:carbamoyl-phosphate synthase large subunit
MMTLSKADMNYLIPKASESSYLDALVRIIDLEKIDVLHAQPDPEVTFIGKHRDQIKARTYLPRQEVLDLAGDKELFTSTLRDAGIPMPRSGSGETRSDLANVVELLLKDAEKVWVRAKRGAGSRASLPVRSVDQALNWAQWWIDERGMAWEDFMASEFLPGKEYALQTFWQDGELISAEARERVAYLYGFLSPSGQSSTPSIARTTRSSQVFDVGLNGIRALDSSPNGVYCADIKTSYDGELKITEVNAGRFFTTSNFFSHAGVNMPSMLVRAAMGENIKPVGIATLPEDLYWIRMVDMGYKLVSGDELSKWVTP